MAKAREKYGPRFDSVHKSTGDPAVDLLIAVLRTAAKDARRGRAEAQDFLDCFLDGALDDRRKIPTKAQCRRK